MYSFYLDGLLLPVTPEKLSVKVKNQNKTMNLMNEGEVNIMKDAGLSDVSFEALIPSHPYPFANYPDGFEHPAVYLTKFKDLKVSKHPFRFIVTRQFPDGSFSFDTNMSVSMESYDIDENAKEGTDAIVSIKLKQFHAYGTKELEISTEDDSATVEEPRSEENSPEPAQDTTYTVKKGDCLWKIARNFYGDGSKWSVIYDANRDVIGGNPDLIYPNQVFMIPAL